MARLRFGHTELNAHLFRIGKAQSPICVCGLREEDNEHFLLNCHLYDSQRHFMMLKLDFILPLGTDVTLNLLLGGPDFKGDVETYANVAKEVAYYVRSTKRWK